MGNRKLEPPISMVPKVEEQTSRLRSCTLCIQGLAEEVETGHLLRSRRLCVKGLAQRQGARVGIHVPLSFPALPPAH